MQGTINTFPTFTEPEKKRRMPKGLIVTLMAALAVACIVVANPTIANRVNTFSGVTREDSTSSIVANVDQALGISGGSVSHADAGRVIVNDSHTAFKAPVQMFTGSQSTVNLVLVNKSDRPVDLSLDLDVPQGLSADVVGKDGVSGVVRTDINTWAFTLEAGEDDQYTDLSITLAVDDLIQPGSYALNCAIEPLKF